MLLMIQVTNLSIQSINDSPIQNTKPKCIVFMQKVYQNAFSNLELTLWIAKSKEAADST